MQVIKEHPTYHVLNDNCQIFAQLLLQAICPGAPVPVDIQCVFKRLLDAPNAETSSLPGAYPRSIVNSVATADSDTTWYTASATTWYTASQTSWYTTTETTQWWSSTTTRMSYCEWIGATATLDVESEHAYPTSRGHTQGYKSLVITRH
jgi:hypothetical protein